MVGARITLNHIDSDAEIVERKRGIPKEVVKVVLETVIEERQNHRNQLKTQPPKGSISLMAAERKYGVNHGTLSRWVKKGFIPVLLQTKNWLYVDESKLAEVVKQYRENPGQGKRTIAYG